MTRLWAPICMLVGALLANQACGGGSYQTGDPGFLRLPGEPRAGGSDGINVQWYRDLAIPYTGRYIPVERAGVMADERGGHVYVGSSYGVLWTLATNGKKLSRYDLGVGIESAPALDSAKDRLWVASITGEIHALRASSGQLLWKVALGHAVSTALTLSSDALYIATDDDWVIALNRDNGDVLWRYERQSNAMSESSLSISGHAGLLLTDNRIITGTTDGVVVALDAGDGHEVWHVDTSVDILRPGDANQFIDVDTTPVRIGDSIFAASFAAGVYEIELKHGVVLSRLSEYETVNHLAEAPQGLLLSSAEDGIVCVDLVSRKPRWRRNSASMRGVPGHAVIDDDKVFVASTRGALVVLALNDGHELARIESGHGYSAAPTVGGQQGYILSNAARLVTFSY